MMTKANPLIKKDILYLCGLAKNYSHTFSFDLSELSYRTAPVGKTSGFCRHFVEHREKNQNLSFLDFLGMHYSQQNERMGIMTVICNCLSNRMTAARQLF